MSLIIKETEWGELRFLFASGRRRGSFLSAFFLKGCLEFDQICTDIIFEEKNDLILCHETNIYISL